MIKTRSLIGVVDDDPSVCKALRRLLKSVGLDSKVFSSAEDLLSFEGIDSLDCLIVDVRMPVMSGLDLQKQLTASGRLLPIIFITAHDDPQAREQGMREGAVDFLQKPFEDRLLLDAMALALGKGKQKP